MTMQPTNELRLKGTVLQQKLINIDSSLFSSNSSKTHEEWIDIPKVEEESNSTNDKPIIGGKWYVDKYESKFLLFTQKWKGKWSKDTFICYGFDFDGNWTYNSDRHLLGMTEASPEYVKNRLFEEAIKRGFVKGAKFFGVQGVDKEIAIEIGDKYQIQYRMDSVNTGLYCGDSWLLYNGQWAKIIPQLEEKKYPASVDEIEGRYFYITSESRAKAILALTQLVELRDAWNKVDGFVVDWTSNKVKYVIVVNSNEIISNTLTNANASLYFGSAETRDKFIETFRPLIEEAKEFL